MNQNKNTIPTVIQQTGFAIRDWLSPFYTLGGVVTFAITMLTFLDPSGMLVKSITALLVVATAVAWAVSLTPARRRPADSAEPASQAPPAHALLLAVTLFFITGWAISEAIMSGKRPSVAPAAPVAQSLPAPVAAPPIPPAPALQTETASALDAVGPSVPAAMAPLPVATTQKKPVRPPEDRATHATSTAAPRAAKTSTVAARTPLSADDAQRCSSLIAKFSLGHTPSTAEKQYLETSCR